MKVVNISFKNIKRGIFPLFILLLSSCSSLSTYERTYTEDGMQVIARDNGVETQVSQKYNYWSVFYVNNTNSAKCVGTTWKVYDLIGKMPKKFIYVEADTKLFIGYFEEQVWIFNKLIISPGGSGYVNDFYVLDPYKDRKDCIIPKGKLL